MIQNKTKQAGERTRIASGGGYCALHNMPICGKCGVCLHDHVGNCETEKARPWIVDVGEAGFYRGLFQVWNSEGNELTKEEEFKVLGVIRKAISEMNKGK